jgi:hypothetical protein
MLLNKYTMIGSSSDEYYFIITAGPTGTGKTSLVNKTLEHLGINPNLPIKRLLIDDLVEQNQVYKNGVDKIIDEVTKECNGDEKCEDEEYEKNVKNFYDSYSKVRGSTCNNDTKLNCDDYLETKLIEAIGDKVNIIVFETTFRSGISWIYEFIPSFYKVVLVFSFVNYNMLKDRIKSRFRDSLTKYKDDKKINAPRLVDTQDKVFVHAHELILRSLYNFYKDCFLHYTDEKTCMQSHKLNRLLISDNTLSHRFEYDSGESRNNLPTPDQLNLIVRTIISLPPHSTESKSGGMTKKTSAKTYKKDYLIKKSSNNKKSKKKSKKISKKKSKKSKPR